MQEIRCGRPRNRQVFLLFLCILFGMQLFQPVYGQLCASRAAYKTTYYEWITNVSLNGNSNTSGQSRYSDFTELNNSEWAMATLQAGNTYEIHVRVQTFSGPWLEKVRVWFDTNQDDAISHPEELLFTKQDNVSAGGSVTFSGTVSVPACAKSGNTHMRVILGYNATPVLCGEYQWGETEDYLVNIVSAGENPPTASDVSATLLEDGLKTFQEAEFLYEDADGHALTELLVTSVVQNGKLLRGFTPIAINTTILTSQIGALTYIPVANGYGDAFDSFSYKVRDCQGLFSAESFTYTFHVQSQDDKATLTPLTVDIEENTVPGTIIGTLEASDIDDTSFDYSIISGNVDNSFSIDPSTGEIQVEPSAAINYTLRQSFVLAVNVTSLPSGGVESEFVTINLLDVAYPTIALPDTFYVKEFLPQSDTIGYIVATDQDLEQLSYMIAGNNPGDALAIDATTGALFINNSASLDTRQQTTLYPNINVLKVATGEVGTSIQAVVNILRPTWSNAGFGSGNYHSHLSYWNINAVPDAVTDRVLLQDGSLSLNQDINIHSMELIGGGFFLYGETRFIIYSDLVLGGGNFGVAKRSGLEIRGAVVNGLVDSSHSLRTEEGSLIVMDGMTMRFGL